MKRQFPFFAIALFFFAAIAGAQTYQGMAIPAAHPRLFGFNDATRYAAAQAWYAANSGSINATCTGGGSNLDHCMNLAFEHLMNNSVDASAAISAALAIMNNVFAAPPSGGVSCSIPATGDNPANSMHDCSEQLILIYDWTYDQMTSTQRSQYLAGGNVWFGNYSATNPYGTGAGTIGYDCALGLDGNICESYVRAAFEWGVASYGENTTNAQQNLTWWETMWGNYKNYASHTSLSNGSGGWQSADAGGLSQEGDNYSKLTVHDFVVPIATAKALGRDLLTETTYFKALPLAVIYMTTPSLTTSVNQGPGTTATCWEAFPWDDGHLTCSTTDLFNKNAGSIVDYADLMSVLSTYYSGVNIGKYAKTWLNELTPTQLPLTPYVASVDASPNAMAYSSLPLDYYAPGPGFFWGRTAWDTSSTIAHWELNTPSDVGHKWPIAGTWQMWRGGRWLSRVTIGYGGSKITGYNGTGNGDQYGRATATNGILVNPDNQGCTAGTTCQGDGGEYTNGGVNSLASPKVNVYIPAQASRLESQASYAYSAVDISGTYGYTGGATYPQWWNPAVNTVVREFVWVRDLETMVIFDRILANAVGSIPAGSIKRTFLAHCENNWTLVDANHATCTSGTQKLALTTLLPATPNPAYHVTNEYTYASDPDAQYRLEVNDTPGTAQSYFAHVLQGMASSGTALTPSITDNGTSYTVTLDSKHSITFNKGATSSGGSITLNGTTTNFTSSVEPITVTDAGPVWGGSSGPALASITVSPATATIAAGGTQQFKATCTYSDTSTADCTNTVTWSSSNTAAATISTGGLATGVAGGSTTIKATSGGVTGSGGLAVNPPSLTVTTTALAEAYVGTSYNVEFIASGGVGPYTWALTSGVLPSGLSLSASGLISGTPTTPSSAAPLTFRVADSNSSTASSAGLTLTVGAAALSLGLGTCTSTMTGTQYVALSGCTLAATGGLPPYTYSWKVVTDGSYAALPEGLTLGSSTGTISGTVYGQGRYVPEFVVTDSAGTSATLSTLVFSIAGDDTLGGCSLFPSDSIFHRRVDSLPVDTSPAAPLPSAYQSASLRAFFGNSGVGNIPNGIPMIRVPYDQPNVTVTTPLYQPYFSSGPIPPYAPPEGTSNNSGDRHVLVIQTAGGGNPCRLWEMYQGVNKSSTSWEDTGNVYWSNIGSTGAGAYAMIPQDTGSTDAAGLPVAPLVVTADEVIGTGTPSAPNGSVQHPIRFTVSQMLNRYVWPATAHAGGGSCSGGYSDANGMLLQGAGAPASCTTTGPAGEIYRLKAGAPNPACAATSPQAAIIIQGLRNYGVILADNGMTGGLIGTPDARWNDNDLACLKSLTLSDFEPVNVSGVASALTPNYNGSGYSAPVTSYQTLQTTLTPQSTLSGITVTPATASVVAGTGTQQYAAQCTYSDSTTADCTATVTWSSSNPAVATITGSGLASGVAAGTTTIKAASGSITGSGVLSVTSPSLIGMAVTPATASIVAGSGTQRYAAQCSYSNSTTADCTATVTWSSSDPAAATITGSGLAGGVAAGSATIKATSGSITGSGVLTVASASVTGITVTPATASIVAGTGTQQYAAQCAYSNSTTADCTANAAWSSSNPAAATIIAGGLAKGVAAGSTTITATSGSITGSSALTVKFSGKPVGLKTGSWAWMDGNNTALDPSKGQPAVDPALGVPSSGNVPGGREEFASWTDSTGNLWLFGGGSADSAGDKGYLNDLWEFLPSAQEWAWMGGSSTVPAAGTGRPGLYGTLGTPAAGNSPGGREALASWTDNTGSLWLFGGAGYDSAGTNGSLNDLWKFDPSSQEWAWESGSSIVPGANEGQPGVYGNLGTPDARNTPGGRWGANSWAGVDGNLWLFGGVGYDSVGALGSLNDLWEFDPSTEKWAWISGSSTVGSGGGRAGAYGSFGHPSTTAVPSGRSQAVSWIDSTGNLWLFGGKGYDSTGTLGYLNDLWEFNPSTREWAWMGGSSTVGCAGCGMPGIYGTLSEADPVNGPGGRNGAVGWTDSNGNFWLFGGHGDDSTGTLGYLNDLWEFNPSTLGWAWMGGSSTVPGAKEGQPGAYGTLGVPAAENAPGSRWGTGGWTDGNGNLWLFGGEGYDSSGVFGYLNDLWAYQPSPGNLPAATPTLSIAPGIYNTPQTVKITDATPGATIYYTTNGATPSTSSSVYSGPIIIPSTTTIEAIASANGYEASAAASSTYTITPSFTMAPSAGSSTSATVQSGGVATYSLVVAPAGSATLPAAITLTASGIPPGSTATFTPSSISAGMGATNVSLSIHTSSTSAMMGPGPAVPGPVVPGRMVPGMSNWTLALCLLFLPLAGMRRWRSQGYRLSASKRFLAGMLLLAGATIALGGCSGTVVLNKAGSGSVTPTAYTVTVTAVGGDVHQTATVTVTVQ